MEDTLASIIASMAAATGNASPIECNAPKRTNGVDADPISTSKKRERVSSLTPPSGIWNPNAEMQLSSSTLLKLEEAVRTCNVSPAMEVARHQIVRALCKKIRRASEDLGIGKLSNSAFENWQLTSQLTYNKLDPLIPPPENDYSTLAEEFRKAGATRSGATKMCKALRRESDRMLRKFHQQNFVNGKNMVHVTVSNDDMRLLTFGQSTVKISAIHFAKMRELYARKHGLDNGDGSSMSLKNQRHFATALFCLLLRYDSLDGGGFQAALNEECFDVLLEEFDCKMECFASPLNCRYSRFCSAFLDTDFAFGSVGSFFDFSPRSGCFEANPPFIPKVIKRMADHMAELLTAANGPLTFIVIIPSWQKTEGWQQLNASRYNQRHVLIPQKQHGFCEGKQQLRKTRWRIASFDTSIFFLQNSKACNQWPVTDQKLKLLKQAFKSKQADERDALGLRRSGKRVRLAKDQCIRQN
ncbi:Phosphorylated CTD interacting factor 1, WW domain [Plasmopara halstedii]|uniref:Phosphorylated CTD interacting factor 1, WW domain n=1 Tax=Plasmopara halstedii TaxID=4781 RepID=A0A0P1A8A2_PLAHL|nr:Phosphorylated CTD interacting factor 1, WW domain [Plasmopara halstedii]CEG36430.1 Phosphorylated CTD interacting factor 1, WW domain [Plasmopara halstedii]|eukprot:XP_024572799.1 Phosphorylated CTD interacting factor 1, WW domain [Plasmopara halstedii]